MKVILLKDVPKLGRHYDVKDVSDGYAQNLLIPKGLVVAATPDAMKRTEVERKRIEGERKLREDLVVKNIKDLEDVIITIKGKANDKGHLFAGLHKDVIVAELQKQTELQLDPSFLTMEHPLKEVGDHMIEVKAAGKSAKFKVVIVAE